MTCIRLYSLFLAHICAHTHTQTHTLLLIGIQSGAQVGEALPIYEQRRKQARCVWLGHRWNQCFSVHKERTHTQNVRTHKMLQLSVCTQTKLHLDMWRLSYAAKLLTLQCACEWQTCESGLLLYKQRRVMRKGKWRKKWRNESSDS